MTLPSKSRSHGTPRPFNRTPISAGHSHSLFVVEDGIYFMVSNKYGQLFVDTVGQDLCEPGTLDSLPTSSVRSFEAGNYSSYILYEDGSVNGCGSNKFGQLGDGTDLDQLLAEVRLNADAARLVVAKRGR